MKNFILCLVFVLFCLNSVLGQWSSCDVFTTDPDTGLKRDFVSEEKDTPANLFRKWKNPKHAGLNFEKRAQPTDGKRKNSEFFSTTPAGSLDCLSETLSLVWN